MIKQTVEYTDFNGTRRKEDVYFNITKTEILNLRTDEDKLGFFKDVESLQTVVLDADLKPGDTVPNHLIEQILRIFKNLVIIGYGIKSDDGRYFDKDEAHAKKFMSSAAWDALYIRFVENPTVLMETIKGMLPDDFAAVMEEAKAQAGITADTTQTI